MDETILFPSPNWFLVSTLAVSSDGWLIYGGPSKSLCVLEPRKDDSGIISGKDKYQAHVVPRANHDKIVSVDISPEWLEKRTFLTGSADGTVKQWVLETVNSRIKIKATHSHEAHHNEKEEIVGVGYSTESIAVSVGCFSNIVKWDLSSNVAKTYSNFIRSFKPTCMSCSAHTPLHVAVGTKQGVVFLVDLHGNGKILYKVRGQDDEVMNVSWCPQYEVTVKKALKEIENKPNLTSRLAAIRNEPEEEHNILEQSAIENRPTLTSRLTAKKNEPEKGQNILEQSGIGKNLPEDSFDESIVQEDDMFDIYKDHEPDEFGHKKYEPEDILVKVKQEKAEDVDYLAECLKLKEEILKRKNQPEDTIGSLVDALDKTHVESGSDVQDHQSKKQSAQASTSTVKCNEIDTKGSFESSHIQKHLLASVGKYGGVRIWSKTGKLVSSCAIPTNSKTPGKKMAFCPTILWYKPDCLLIVDGKNELLECNPLTIDCKNKLEWRIAHTLHKRGMNCIATNAPRVQTGSNESKDWSVWSTAQDRNIIRYCVKSKKALAVHGTCGGFVYTLQTCPYDAGKIAISVGDGAVRIWECSPVEDESKLSVTRVTSYWQNVQGKVLTLAWHPTKENMLAFATAESRVGLIDTSGKSEKPARALFPALHNGVYSLCWGEGMQLYASGGGSLVLYHANQPDQGPLQVEVTVEGQAWQVCAVSCSSRALLVGSLTGAVALLTLQLPHTLLAAAFIFTKMIHTMEWHPQQTSSSSEMSPYKDLIAVSALDRESNIVILEYGNKEDGTKHLSTWKTLSGHKLPVLQLAWNPHRDGYLLSSSQDCTVRVWDIAAGSCVSIFGDHTQSSLGVAWLALPQWPHHVMSGGGDATVRLWDIRQHKAENYDETKHEVLTKKHIKAVDKKDKKEKKDKEEQVADIISTEDQEQLATNFEASSLKPTKLPKKFMLSIMYKQINDRYKLVAAKKMLQLYLQKLNAREQADNIHNATTIHGKGDNTTKEDSSVDDKQEATDVTEQENSEVEIKEESNSAVEDEGDIEDKGNSSKVQKPNFAFLKVFGTIKEVNEFLDLEMENHLEAWHPEAWIMLSIFRGHIDTMIQFASQRDMLCPFLLSMAPCVSFKYWKDATQLYLAQIDRLVARGEEEKLYENRQYGGPTYRKAAILLSMHDVMGAVAALMDGKLFKEAYILCRIRYMDSVAEDVLSKWAYDLVHSGNLTMGAVCYIAMDNLSQAAQVLARSQNQDYLSFAADIAKIAGRTVFADHVEKKALTKSQGAIDKTEDLLKELPSKIELLMKEDKVHNSDNVEFEKLNGKTLNRETNGDAATIQ